MKIITNHVYPPIPLRQFDWSAFDDDTYDGEGCVVGWGATEAEAIADFHEQMESEADDALIAAAPDLLAALQAIMRGCVFDGLHMVGNREIRNGWVITQMPTIEAFDAARDAIAKATDGV